MALMMLPVRAVRLTLNKMLRASARGWRASTKRLQKLFTPRIAHAGTAAA